MRRLGLFALALILIYSRADGDTSLPPLPARAQAGVLEWAPRCAARLTLARDRAAAFDPELSRAAVEIGRVPVGRGVRPSVELRLQRPGESAVAPSLTAYLWLGAAPNPSEPADENWVKPTASQVKPIVPFVRRLGHAYAMVGARDGFGAGRLERVLAVVGPAVDDCLFWGRDAAR